MEIEEAIENHLFSKTALTALIGDRLDPDETPEEKEGLPALVYQLISGVDDHSLGDDPDSTEARYQFTIIADSAASRAAVYKQLKAAFKDFTGAMGAKGEDLGVNVSSVLQVNRIDSSDPKAKIYLRMVDFMFIYDEN